MPTPDFVLELRRRIGHDPLPLVGVTAVVFRGEKVLVGRRADNGRLQCISGIVDPGEEPADAAVRECLEEAGVVVRAERLALVQTLPRTTYANGDQVSYLMTVFRCDVLEGEPRPDGDEIVELRYFSESDLVNLNLPNWGPVVLPDAIRERSGASFQSPEWRPPDPGA